MGSISVRGALRQYWETTSPSISLRDKLVRRRFHLLIAEFKAHTPNQVDFRQNYAAVKAFANKFYPIRKAEMSLNDWTRAFHLIMQQHDLSLGTGLAEKWATDVWNGWSDAGYSFPLKRNLRGLLNIPQIQYDQMHVCNTDGLDSQSRDYAQLWSHVEVEFRLDWDKKISAELRLAYANYMKICIETWWNNRWACRSGDELACPITFTANFIPATSVWQSDLDLKQLSVDTDWHNLTNFPFDEASQTGGWYGSTWYFDRFAFSATLNANSRELVFMTMVPVHEFGHMLGLFDEYEGGCIVDDAAAQWAEDQALGFDNTVMKHEWFFNVPFPARLFREIAQNIGAHVVALPFNDRFMPPLDNYGSLDSGGHGAPLLAFDGNQLTKDRLLQVFLAYRAVQNAPAG